MNMSKRVISAIVASAFLVNVSGCATTRLSPTVEQKVNSDAVKAEAHIKSLQDADKRIKLVEHDDGIWLGSAVIPISKKAVLPDIFQKNITFERSVTLQEVAERITTRTGLPVKIATDVLQPAPGSSSTNNAAQLTGSGGAQTNNNPATMVVKFNYTGTVAGLLDTIAARFNTHWKYENGNIHLFNLETRTFALNAIPGDSSLDATVGSNTSTGSGGSGGSSSTSNANSASSQSTSVKSALSVWTGVKDSLTAMISASGKLNVSPSTGSVTVTDTPEVLDRVASYIDTMNKTLGRQVLVNVKVLNVSLSDNDDYGLNWNAVYQNVSKSWGFTLKSAIPVAAAASLLDLQILSTAGKSSGVSTFAGSDAMISALSTQGKVSLVTSASFLTLNNQPVPVQVARQTSYLQSVSTTNTANVGSSTSLTPGTFTTGFSMNVLPHILENGKVLLQYSVDLSTLNKLNTVTSGSGASSATIQTPEIDTRNFLQRVAMNNGETLVLSGFEQNTDDLKKSGTGSPDSRVAGGNTNATHNHDLIVILLTPVLSGS